MSLVKFSLLYVYSGIQFVQSVSMHLPIHILQMKESKEILKFL